MESSEYNKKLTWDEFELPEQTLNKVKTLYDTPEDFLCCESNPPDLIIAWKQFKLTSDQINYLWIKNNEYELRRTVTTGVREIAQNQLNEYQIMHKKGSDAIRAVTALGSLVPSAPKAIITQIGPEGVISALGKGAIADGSSTASLMLGELGFTAASAGIGNTIVAVGQSVYYIYRWRKGEITLEQLFKNITVAFAGAGGGVAGAVAGTALGSLAGPIGASIGAVIGSVVGSLFVQFASSKVGNWIIDEEAERKKIEDRILVSNALKHFNLIQSDLSMANLRLRYRDLVLKKHPDRNGGKNEEFITMQFHYEILKMNIENRSNNTTDSSKKNSLLALTEF